MFRKRMFVIIAVMIMFVSLIGMERPNTVVQAATNTIQRFESMNMPGYAIRHQNSRGRVDTEIAPIEDAQFRQVPGLADASCVSFQSVNFPNNYLRHRNGEIWCDTNDNSTIFKADATWRIKPGLANSSLVSFESYNFPGEYIRHRDYLLYRTPISTDLDKQDATFKIWEFNWSWVKGAVFVPTNVTNEVQQWDEYNSTINDRELRYASVYGINLVRVYLHFLVWQKNKTTFLANIENFLQLANKYGIKTEFIFFDDCWNANPTIGSYPAPLFGVHNSRWVQCPGNYIKENYASYKPSLQSYVQDVVNAHKTDSRIAFWEPYNEPGNGMSGIYFDVTNQILRDSRAWIKATGTTIPITSCDFAGTVSPAVSDFYAFHNYDSTYGGPRGTQVLNTECMNRGSQSVPGVDNAYYHNANPTGYIMWELGIGRDNCRYPWGNTSTEPTSPFHGIVYPDGHPWSIADVQAIKNDDLSNAPVFNVEYYAANNFTDLRKTSITPLIDFDLGNEFGTGSPDASVGIGVDNFSTRWTGSVLPASTGTYTFYADGDNVIRVWVGGVQVINKTGGARSEVSGNISLNVNQAYDFKVEYVHGTGDSSLHIRWSGPSLSKQVLLGRKPVSTGVVFYQDINFGGTATPSYGKGNYSSLPGGVPNDWMSSLKVPAGWTVEVYADGGFGGTKWTFTADTSWVGSDCNDKMSSFKIY